MNILLVNHYAGNSALGMEFRPYYLAREWVKSGHRVLIASGSFSHLRKKQPKASAETIDGVSYRWLWTPKYKGNGAGRFLSMLCFVAQLFLHKRAWRRFKPDVVIASSTYPIDNWPCCRIARSCGAKYIYEIHDLWPLSPMELGGMSAKHPFIRLMQWGEDYAYRHADKVVSILPCVHEHVKEHGLPLDKLALVPNGIVEEDWAEQACEALPEEHRQLLQKLKAEKKFLVGFAGAHGKANALKSFIDASLLLPSQQTAFVLVGTGQEKDHLIRYVAENHIPNVYFLPPVSKRSIPVLFSSFDLLYVGLQKQRLFRFGISPNKIFDYMMAGKPVIMAIEAGNNLVAEADCGWCVEPENPVALAKAIETAAACSAGHLAQLGENGWRYVKAHHTYKNLAQLFIQAIETA